MGAVWGQATRAEVLSLRAQQSWRGQCWGGHSDGSSGALSLEEEIS